MERITLSERFVHIKAVSVDSTESDSDFSDNDIMPKVSTESFKYCDKATMLFSGSLVQHMGKDCDDVDSDSEMLEMEPEWIILFQKILKKSRNLSHTGRHSQVKGTSLCDKVPRLDNSLPLQCLKNTLDQYNKYSQDSVSNSVSDDLITDELTIERNETEMDICEENIEEIGNEITEKLVSGQTQEQSEFSVNCCPVVNGSFKNEKGNKLDDENVTVTEETFENCKMVKSGETDFIDLNVCKSVEKVELHTKGDAAFDTESDKETIDKSKSEKGESSVETPTERNQQHIVSTENTNTSMSSAAILQDDIKGNEQSIAIQSLNTSSVPVKSKEAVQLTVSDETIKEIVKNKSPERSTKFPKELDKTAATSCLSTSKKTKSSEKNRNLSGKPDNNPVLQENSRERTENRKKTSQICSTEKDTTYIVVSESKNLSKVKTLKIKPSLSFPLDELLPPPSTIPAKKRKAIEDISATRETAVIPRKRHTSETYDNDGNLVPKDADFTLVPPHPFDEGDTFHGTVYDSSPKKDLWNKNLEESERMTTPNNAQACDLTDEWDIGMANLVTALQSGNQQVITMFQAALHDQIGSNLEALAFKARQNYSQSPAEPENPTSSSFGFYTERAEKTNQEPGATGDNATSEKYDELLHLLVEQCSALVKTEEDNSKLKSLLKVLKKEGEKKFINTGFTPPPEIEVNSHSVSCSVNESGDDLSYIRGQEATTNNSTNEIELFEGRTLLKGGVKPRHIPKTTVHKSGLDPPKDPRPYLITGESKCTLKLPLPEFAVELYGEKKVKQMLHLDWSMLRNQSVPVSENDPRVKKASAIDSNLKLIVDATKTLIENLHMSQENFATESNIRQENNIESTGELPVLSDVRYAQEIPKTTQQAEVKGKGMETVNRHIPVLITDSNQMTHTQPKFTQNRNPVLHHIETAKSSDTVNLDKKACIGVVKPLVEQTNSKMKETKPSVGIVKPIQVRTAKTPWAGPRKDTKISPLGTNRQSINMELDSDIEDGEIGTTEQLQSKERKSNIKLDFEVKLPKGERISKVAVDKRAGDKNVKKKTYLHENVTASSKVVASSDASGSEDGQIDTDLETAFTEKVSVFKKDKRVGSRDKDRSSRNYRKRDRSSSISSVDSRISYSSKDKRGHYINESSNKYDSLDKSNRRDRSQGTDSCRLRSPSKDTDNSHHYRHRRRHHTSKDERSYKDSADRSGAVKRHQSLGDGKRKRHRTEEGRTATFSDITLSDEDFSKEYRAKFGGTKIIETHSSVGDRGLQGYCPVNSWADYDKTSEKVSKSRRKSFEDQQKEVMEDKKFLEYCKQKFVGKSGTVTMSTVPVRSGSFAMPRQSETSVYRTKPATSTSASYNDTLHLADLEDGEI